MLCPATFLRHEASLSSDQVPGVPLLVSVVSGGSLCILSVVNIIMGARWPVLASLLIISLAQVKVEATMWSNIGFMSGQDQANKRSAEDGQEMAVEDMDLSASETHYDSLPYSDLGSSSPGDAESRAEPMRRRK